MTFFVKNHALATGSFIPAATSTPVEEERDVLECTNGQGISTMSTSEFHTAQSTADWLKDDPKWRRGMNNRILPPPVPPRPHNYGTLERRIRDKQPQRSNPEADDREIWQHLPCLGDEKGKFLLRAIRLKHTQGPNYVLRILVVGKTGEGKSTLINTLLGRPVTPVNRNCLDPTRHRIEPIEATFNSIKVLIWDTQGTQDGTDMEDETFTKVRESMDRYKLPGEDIGADVVLVCMSLIHTRFDADTQETLRKITEALGMGVWKRAILTLTMANVMVTLPAAEKPAAVRLCTLVEKLGSIVLNSLKSMGVPHSTLTKIKVIPVGLFDPCRPNTRQLPGYNDWPSHFWCACADRVQTAAGRSAFVIANEHRLCFDDTTINRTPQNQSPSINVESSAEGLSFLTALIKDCLPLLRVLAMSPDGPYEVAAIEDGRRKATNLLDSLYHIVDTVRR